jgi:hypothetical protein
MAMTKHARRILLERKIIECLRAGDTVKAIARNYRVGKTRVRVLREKAVEFGYIGQDPKPIPQYPEALFPDFVDRRSLKTSGQDLQLQNHVTWVKDRLLAGWRPITVFEELPTIGVVDVGRSSFYRFLERHDLYKINSRNRAQLTMPIHHTPGEALILDWGKLLSIWDEDTKKRKTLWAFVGVMGFSRYMMVRLVWTNTVETTVAALESMFDELGGVPTKITSDNPKCFAIAADQYDPLLNPAMEKFASHYGFILECLPPSDPQKKGKVERLMPYVRRIYESHPKEWLGFEEAQLFMNKKVTIANERKHGTTMQKPIDVFLNIETAALKALPSLRYEHHQFSTATVRKDAFVRFDTKYYAVDDKFIGVETQILATHTQVCIFHRGKIVESYERNWDHHKPHSIKEHLLKPHQKIIQDHGYYLKRAETLGPSVRTMVLKLLTQNQGFLDFRKIWGILSLDKNYPPEAINEACATALQMNLFSSRAVKNILQTGKPRLPTTTKITSAKFARPVDDYQEHLTLFH